MRNADLGMRIGEDNKLKKMEVGEDEAGENDQGGTWCSLFRIHHSAFSICFVYAETVPVSGAVRGTQGSTESKPSTGGAGAHKSPGALSSPSPSANPVGRLEGRRNAE